MKPWNRGFENIFLDPLKKRLHQIVKITEILIERRPTRTRDGHQFGNRHLAERPRPEELERLIEDRLAGSLRLPELRGGTPIGRISDARSTCF